MGLWVGSWSPEQGHGGIFTSPAGAPSQGSEIEGLGVGGQERILVGAWFVCWGVCVCYLTICVCPGVLVTLSIYIGVEIHVCVVLDVSVCLCF